MSAPDAVASADRLAALLPEAQVSTAHGVVTADVPRERWVPAVTAVRDDEVLDGTFFDCLVVVDQSPDGFEVVVRLWSVGGRRAVHLRTTCPREDASVPSLVGVFAGASWHEREGEEMFGVVFEGAPDRRRLLLPEGGVAHPLAQGARPGGAHRGAVARGGGPGLPGRGRPSAAPSARPARCGARGRSAVSAPEPGGPAAGPPARSRGSIALLEENCTVCMLCARECPDWCLHVEGHTELAPPERPGGRARVRNVLDRFAIDFSLCMYCGICIEVCPFDALFWAPEPGARRGVRRRPGGGARRAAGVAAGRPAATRARPGRRAGRGGRRRRAAGRGCARERGTR